MHRGDRVAVTAGATTFTGTVTHVGLDVLRVGTPGGTTDVNLAAVTTGTGERRRARLPAPVVLRVIERARAGGRRASGGAETFRARLLEHEADSLAVVVGSFLLDEELRGTLTVGHDQVCVADRDGRETYVPVGWVSWVALRPA